MTRCSVCNQAFQPDATTDVWQGRAYHSNPTDCVAAVVRRCLDIADMRAEKATYTRAIASARLIAGEIRREFPEVTHPC